MDVKSCRVAERGVRRLAGEEPCRVADVESAGSRARSPRVVDVESRRVADSESASPGAGAGVDRPIGVVSWRVGITCNIKK